MSSYTFFNAITFKQSVNKFFPDAAKMNKVGGMRGCFDANSSRGASPILDSFYTSSSAS